jgi:predicted Zn-dependent protease
MRNGASAPATSSWSWRPWKSPPSRWRAGPRGSPKVSRSRQPSSGSRAAYSYAGGVGIRSGDTTDVSRLLLAGLYHSAQQARARHDSASAAELFAEIARRFPDDTTARFLAIESLVHDRNDGKAALAALARLSLPPGDQRLRLRYDFLKADAFLAAGQPDSARATLDRLARDFPVNARIKDRLAQIK